MKRIILISFGIIVLLVLIIAWIFFGPATKFPESSRYLYVRDQPSGEVQIMRQVDTAHLIRNSSLFSFLAKQSKAWQRVKPGRFEIKKGESIFSLVRKLRNNSQSAVRLTVKKIRVREDLAHVIGRNFSSDSATAMNFLSNNDSLIGLGVDTNTVMTLVIPDTYFFNWNTSVKNILERLKNEEEKFWVKDDRRKKASSLNLTPNQVYTLASIVEEETNKNDEKGNIASVYYNRLNNGMKLQADPTVKYATRNFAAKRIYTTYLSTPSAYNTYLNYGLPPGPICTPQTTTIDAVLNMPRTDYLFFVARSDFSGYHQFSNNFAEHQKYARQYQEVLNEWLKRDSLNKNSAH
ncbi:MAG TPA: endolytic transglycosylase MltG [Parafilimonas sp.]|nr:endolytic transglycosylase MltG [Parafilimonas sp.]